jgi:hypothetical protein
MSTITLKTGETLPRATFEDVMLKLKELEYSDTEAFFRLVIACRNPLAAVKRCIQPPVLCRNNNHVDCMSVEPYLGLIKSFDEAAHAEIDPYVRAIVLAATPGVQMPRLISPPVLP